MRGRVGMVTNLELGALAPLARDHCSLDAPRQAWSPVALAEPRPDRVKRAPFIALDLLAHRAAEVVLGVQRLDLPGKIPQLIAGGLGAAVIEPQAPLGHLPQRGRDRSDSRIAHSRHSSR